MKWSSRWYAPLDNTSRLVCKECHDKDVNTVRNPAKSCETCGTASRSRWHPGTNPDAKLCHACYSKKHKKQPPLEVKVVERDGKTVGYARPNPRSTVRRSAVSKRASVDEARDTAEASVVSLGASHLQTGSAEGEDAQAGEPCSEEAGTLQGASHPGGAHDEAARDGARGSLSDASTLMAMPTSGGKAEDGAQEAATEGEQVGSESAQKEEDLAVVEEIATPPTGGVPDPAGTSLEKDQTGKSSQEGADRAPATVLQETPSSVSVKRRLRNSEEGAAEAAGEDEGPQKKRSLREMEKRSPKRGPKSVSGIGPAVVPRKGGRGEGGSGEGLAGNGGKRCDDCGATESRAWYGMSQGVCRCSICYSRDYEKNRRAQRSGAKELELLRLDAGKGGSLRLGSKRKQPLQSPCKSGASVGTPGPAQKGGKRKQGEASRGAPGPSKRRSEPGQESEPGLCTDCGTRESSHWYRGPRGPRTQCRKCYDRVWGGPCHLCSADVSCMWYGGPNGPRTTCSTCYGRYFRPKKDSAAGEVSKRSLPQKPVSLGRGVSLDAELVSRRVGILWPIDGV